LVENFAMLNQQALAADPAALVSVVIPAYNTERYLRRAIDSVLAQRYRPLECIVVDDGSTDGTGDIARSFGNQVRYIRQRNAGASAARNAGILASRGAYVAFLDSDDYWLDTKLENQMRVLSAHPELRLVSTLWAWLPSNTDPGRTDFSGPEFDEAAIDLLPGWESLLRDPYLGTPTVVVAATAAKAVGGFDVKLRSAEDIDFFMRVCDGQPYAVLKQRLVGFQLRQGSLTRTENSHRHNLDLLTRLSETRPEVRERFGATLTECRLDIYRRWARTSIFHGNGPRARSLLRESRKFGRVPEYWHLWLKSYSAPAVKKLRDHFRPMAREDQTVR
jgi:glycosyltransferase involved in cell wall biosynthesis